MMIWDDDDCKERQISKESLIHIIIWIDESKSRKRKKNY